MKIPMTALIFGGIPEQIALVTLAFEILSIPVRWRETVLIGTSFAWIAYLLRLLPITFGVHTIVLVGILFLVLMHFYTKPISSSLLASLISFLALILFESVTLSLLTSLFKINSYTLNTNILIRTLVAWPQVLLLFLSALIIKKVRDKRCVK